MIICSLFLVNGEPLKANWIPWPVVRASPPYRFTATGGPCVLVGELPKTVSVDLFPGARQFYGRGILWSSAWLVHAKIQRAEWGAELEAQGLVCGCVFDSPVCRTVFSAMPGVFEPGTLWIIFFRGINSPAGIGDRMGSNTSLYNLLKGFL